MNENAAVETGERPAEAGHTPVMLAEALHVWAPRPGLLYVDATVGGGGHSAALWPLIQPGGQLIALDQDADTLGRARQREPLASAGEGIVWLHANFSAMADLLAQRGITHVSGGILADLGVSSFQLDAAGRGFSFLKDAPLDMRMNPHEATATAADLVNTASEAELVRILSDYGEERLSKSIARELVARRQQWPLRTTGDLADLVVRVYQRTLGRARGRIHPATQTFQALRIAVNDEMGHLQRFLAQLPTLLAPGSRVVVLSFHSLEDRLVKRAFRDGARPGPDPADSNRSVPYWRLLTPKPLRPCPEEVRANPRARSARLRAVEALAPDAHKAG